MASKDNQIITAEQLAEAIAVLGPHGNPAAKARDILKFHGYEVDEEAFAEAIAYCDEPYTAD